MPHLTRPRPQHHREVTPNPPHPKKIPITFCCSVFTNETSSIIYSAEKYSKLVLIGDKLMCLTLPAFFLLGCPSVMNRGVPVKPDSPSPCQAASFKCHSNCRPQTAQSPHLDTPWLRLIPGLFSQNTSTTLIFLSETGINGSFSRCR